MPEFYVGLISGTSTDGVDAALVDFEGGGAVLVHALNHPYPWDLRKRTEDLLSPEWEGPLTAFGRLHAALGTQFAAAASRLIEEAGVDKAAIRAIGSHGQTVCHHPHGDEAFTLQLADPNRICALTGITTVADFRGKDIALGGQGAPLAPAFHAAMLQSREESRVILNLGGIANITVLPSEAGIVSTGYDTGPANTLMDGWSRRHRGIPFDENGEWAASGTAISALLEALMSEPYLALPAPKSTGRELFNQAWLDPILRQYAPDAEPADVQATLLEFTARSIAEAIARDGAHPDRVLVCGGGAHNRYLLARLAALLGDTPVETTTEHGVPVDWMEAMAFAWMARQTLHHRPGNLASVTGACRPAILGAIYPAD